MRTVLTTAEKERERRLRADPLALVINSAFVECKQCGRKIKLSSKMAFDPLHWRNHRTRCVKRQKKKRGAMHSMRDPSPSPQAGACAESPPARPLIQIPQTPEPSDESSTSSPPPMASPSSIRHHPEVVEITQTNENGKSIIYFVPRPYRPPTPTSGVPGPSEGWRTWSWSQLKLPDFEATALRFYNDLLSDDPDPDHVITDSLEARQRREAAVSLSLLSRSP